MFITRHEKPYALKGQLPTVGEQAPHFSLESIRGEVKTPESFKGRVTLISVVPDINTRVCDIQTKAFHQKMKEYPSIQLVTISKNTKEEFATWCSANDVAMEMLCDVSFAFGEAYGIYVPELGVDERSIFVLDQSGTIVYQELVQEMTHEPDYDAAIQAAQRYLS